MMQMRDSVACSSIEEQWRGAVPLGRFASLTPENGIDRNRKKKSGNWRFHHSLGTDKLLDS
jgi:hypothetical protein